MSLRVARSQNPCCMSCRSECPSKGTAFPAGASCLFNIVATLCDIFMLAQHWNNTEPTWCVCCVSYFTKKIFHHCSNAHLLLLTSQDLLTQIFLLHYWMHYRCVFHTIYYIWSFQVCDMTYVCLCSLLPLLCLFVFKYY